MESWGNGVLSTRILHHSITPLLHYSITSLFYELIKYIH